MQIDTGGLEKIQKLTSQGDVYLFRTQEYNLCFRKTIFSKASIPIWRIKLPLKSASSIFLNFTRANIVNLMQILKQSLHSLNCYTKQVAQLLKHNVHLPLHITTFVAKKYYVLRNLLKNLRNIQVEAKNYVSYQKICNIWHIPITIEWDHFVSGLELN